LVSYLRGDIEKTAEAQLLKEQADLHRGYYQSAPSRQQILPAIKNLFDAVGPKIAVIQGEGRQQLRSSRMRVVVQRYSKAAGAEVYRTDYHGTITVKCQ